MLDTYGRKYVSPWIQKVAQLLIRGGLKPNQVTLLAFGVGGVSIFCLLFEKPWLAVLFLWISGSLDAVDGAMARQMGKASEWGAFLDICLDRVVEAGVILVLGWQYPHVRFPLMLLLTAILISMTVFLTSGALFKQKKEKAFYYQAGLAERTEGFIFLSLMMVWNTALIVTTYLFVGVIVFTIFQRVYEAYGVLAKRT